jgi:hypothetical protein
MLNLTTIIENIERLAYDVLIWTLLVPKTLVKIVIDPGWVRGYVTKELTEKDEARFDGYLSPIILIILTSVLPFLYSYLTPMPAVTIQGPEEVKVNSEIDFHATADFISERGNFKYVWTADENLPQTWEHDQTTDYVTFKWSTPGWKAITVTATNEHGEELIQWYDIYVLDPSEKPSLSASNASHPPENNHSKDYLDALEGPTGILATLGFLSIPLLFAIATEAFRGYPLTRLSLRRSFYIQCYYFAPFNLALWSLLLGMLYFVTPIELAFIRITSLAALFMLLWLIRNETIVIAQERRIHILLSFFIVLICLAAIVGFGLEALLLTDPETFRLFLAQFYVWAIAIAVIAWIIQRVRRMHQRNITVVETPVQEQSAV